MVTKPTNAKKCTHLVFLLHVSAMLVVIIRDGQYNRLIYRDIKQVCEPILCIVKV
jgi:hypothetical protein